MAGLNKVMLIGHLGADPETRYMPNGNAVTNIRLATSESWKDRQSGEQQERTEWHRIVMFGRLGEVAAEYLRKGSQAYVEGRLQTRKWQAQDGSDRWSTEIIASGMQMLGSRRNAGDASGIGASGDTWDGTPKSPSSHPPSGAQPGGAPSAGSPSSSDTSPSDSFDDDIPF